jgi:hypothetical protein
MKARELDPRVVGQQSILKTLDDILLDSKNGWE